VKHQLYLGSAEIEGKIRAAWGERDNPSHEVTREQSKTVLPEADVILKKVKAVYGTQNWNRRDPRTREAKRVAVYLLKNQARLKQKDIGAIFDIGYSAVSHCLRDVKALMKSDVRFYRKLQSDKFKT
jgi:chromosomal replication initiation ATPase DnaA